ncbi:MAG: hypothetical protein KatS3mg023_3922 [Armatimonadota bacterium]|nr:MAG: hypothetical protein KatS3mg023_3922 [Armatimonadota bacterium]
MARRVNVYLHDAVQSEALRRGHGNRENVVNRDLSRYYTLLRVCLGAVALSDQEWDYLRDALNGTIFSAELIPYLPHALADAVKDASFDGLGEKWGVDANALAGKILELSPAEALAVVDAVECWWEAQE